MKIYDLNVTNMDGATKKNSRTSECVIKTDLAYWPNMSKRLKFVTLFSEALMNNHDIKNKTYIWWIMLCLAALMNIAVWTWAILTQADLQGLSLAQPVLSGIYVIVCAFRSLFPRIDVERYCLFDSPWSSIFLGRSLATIAELAFSAQVALLIHYLGEHVGSHWIIMVSYSILPIIVLAQISCWYATLTLNHFWHGIEEILWVVMAALAGATFVHGYFVLTGIAQTLMLVGIASSIGAAAIMLFLDIPMYLDRTRHTGQRRYLRIADGLRDTFTRRVQTNDWGVWKSETIWISSYFTFGVWLSISMIFIKF
jgi:hypothetical protein